MKVVKRDGKVEKFDKERIFKAVEKAINATDVQTNIAEIVDDICQKIGQQEKIQVEEIQNFVENALMEKKLFTTAKAYIIYRKQRQEVRKVAKVLGISDPFHMPLNSLQILAARYLRKDKDRKIIETPKQLYERVAKNIAIIDKKYGATKEQVKETEKDFYDMMINFDWCPNSPTLMNAGTKLAQLAACFVFPIEDSISGIFDALKWTALTQQAGGGTGFSFSKLRPEGDVVQSTGGIASGPITFMEVFNTATETIKQGGKRRGANLGTLRCNHPDIFKFVTAKSSEGKLENFNLSIGATDEFMESVEKGKMYNLVNPRSGEVVRQENARSIFDLAVHEAWKTGDPAFLFLDTINKSVSNCIPKYGPIESSNPCGEICMYPFESCNLGSINLSNIVKNSLIDWDKLKSLINLGVHFLDNVIDANKYIIPQVEQAVKRGRRIGLGVMGWADMLIKLKIPYNSEEALKLAEKVMGFIEEKSHEYSKILGEERGNFPEFENSVWVKKGYKNLRNCTTTTVAPTGTISIIAGGVSSGIEPIFSVSYMRNVEGSIGTNLFEVNQQFERMAMKMDFYSEDLLNKVSQRTSVQGISEVPEDIRGLFVTAHDVSPEWHIRMQAAFQKHTDNSISKTINMPMWATPKDIEQAYMMAWKLKCKGITVYRDQCRSSQVLSAFRSCPECAIG